MTIQFVGCGNMGSVILQSLIKYLKKNNDSVASSPLHSESQGQIFVKEINPDFDIQQFDYPVKLGIDLDADIVFLGIKPQQLDQIDLTGFSRAVLVSYLAGTKIEKLEKTGNWKGIIRCMPNLLMKVGNGVTGFNTYGEIEALRNGEVFNIIKGTFSESGIFVELENEDMIDKITALTGSGPAYIYLFAEYMIKKAVEFGFSEVDSEKMIKNLFLGASKMMMESEKTPEELRKLVTSKGGTTHAAIESFEKNNLQQIISEAVGCAYERAGELS